MSFKLFRDLSPQEEKEAREYARKNDPPNIENWNAYHPVCREEWLKRGIIPPTHPDDIITAGMRAVVEVLENLSKKK